MLFFFVFVFCPRSPLSSQFVCIWFAHNTSCWAQFSVNTMHKCLHGMALLCILKQCKVSNADHGRKFFEILVLVYVPHSHLLFTATYSLLMLKNVSLFFRSFLWCSIAHFFSLIASKRLLSGLGFSLFLSFFFFGCVHGHIIQRIFTPSLELKSLRGRKNVSNKFEHILLTWYGSALGTFAEILFGSVEFTLTITIFFVRKTT